MIQTQVISSGSEGNAVIYNNAIMVDCGVSLKALNEVKNKKMNNDIEIWVDIKEYQGDYLVSNKGRIKSLKFKLPRIRKDGNNGHGYRFIPLTKNGVTKNFYIHRLVAEHFIPNPENKSTVNHKDGNKNNNCVDNLEWATQSENSQHGFDTGLNKQKSGAENKSSKAVIQYSLSGDFIREYVSMTEAGNTIGCAASNIGACCRGKYKQVKGFIWKYKNE